MTWDELGFIKSGRHRQKILKMLATKNMMPTEISDELKIHLSQVTRNLGELEERGLIKCLTPSLRKGRLYSATEKGKKLLKR